MTSSITLKWIVSPTLRFFAFMGSTKATFTRVFAGTSVGTMGRVTFPKESSDNVERREVKVPPSVFP